MVNSHIAVSTRKGLNCFVWCVVSEKRGKWELLNHYRIITNVANQNAIQEQPHNTPKVNILEKQFSNEELLSSVKCRTWTNTFCLTHLCCPSSFTDKNCGGMAWQELNQGQCKSDSPCLMQRIWVQEWRQSQSSMNSWRL